MIKNVKEPPIDPNALINPVFHTTEKRHDLWRWMRNNIPIYWHDPTHLPGFWSVTRYKDVKAIYANPQVFSSAKGVLLRPAHLGVDPGGGLTLALTDPPKHKKLRDLMKGWFSVEYAKSLEEIVQDKIRVLLHKAAKKTFCNFSSDIASPLTLFVTCHILGIPAKNHDDILHWTHEAFSAGQPLAAHKEFMLFFCEFMEYKKANPADDLASAIVHGMIDDRPFAEKEIILNFENLVGATENAGLSISSGILAFIQRPQNWALLKNNTKLMKTAIEEVLRWASSASHSMRTVTEEITINNIRFRAGDCVALWLPSANRDEEVFDNPYKFNITRLPNPHIALGYREHFCIGQALGKMQMRLLLTEILTHNWNLTLDKEPTYLKSIHVNGPEILPVRITRNT